jgi:hypothetical protein
MTILFTAPLSIFDAGLSNAGRRSKFFSEKAATLRRSALRGARAAASRVVQRNCHTLRKTSLRRAFGGETSPYGTANLLQRKHIHAEKWAKSRPFAIIPFL